MPRILLTGFLILAYTFSPFAQERTPAEKEAQQQIENDLKALVKDHADENLGFVYVAGTEGNEVPLMNSKMFNRLKYDVYGFDLCFVIMFDDNDSSHAAWKAKMLAHPFSEKIHQMGNYPSIMHYCRFGRDYEKAAEFMAIMLFDIFEEKADDTFYTQLDLEGPLKK